MVFDGKEMVLVSAQGNLEPLLKYTLDQPGLCARPGGCATLSAETRAKQEKAGGDNDSAPHGAGRRAVAGDLLAKAFGVEYCRALTPVQRDIL